MTQPQGTVWDGVLAAVVLFAIMAFLFRLLLRWAFLFLVLLRWAWKRDQRTGSGIVATGGTASRAIGAVPLREKFRSDRLLQRE